MSKPKRQIIVLLLLVMGMAAGCQPSGPTSTPTLPGESLEWEKIIQSPGWNSEWQHEEGAGLSVVASQKEMELVENILYPELRVRLLNCDFSNCFVIVIYQGKQGSTDYSIIVRDVRKDGNTITVHTSFRSPGPDSVVGASETFPYYVLEVIKTLELEGDFTFVLMANDQELLRQTHSIP